MSVRPPGIISTIRDRLGPATAPSVLRVSHPVPPLVEQPQALRARSVPEMSLTADRTQYVVEENEFPTYAITGAHPNETILWSLWQDGVKVVDDQAFEKATDEEGNWFGVGSPWMAAQAGFWVVLARTGDRHASVRFLVTARLNATAPTPPESMLGVAHVAGLYRFATRDSELAPVSFLVEGARHVRNLGARHLFVYLTPQYRTDYRFDDFGGETYAGLTALASSPEYQEVFSLPFETFVVTAYTFANWDWIVRRGGPGAVSFQADREREEFAELARHLPASYPEKNFVLKNWEGDWQMKSSFDLDAVASEEQVSEMIEWMRARQDGIASGRSNGTRVQHAIEMNLLHQAQRGLASVLASVIPEVASDLIAYSTWWSLGRPGDRVRNLRDDIAFIRAFPAVGGRPVLVSEFGVSCIEPDGGPRTIDAVEACSCAGVERAFYWQIFDNGPNFALVGPEATRFDSWHAMRGLTGARNDAVFVREETEFPTELIAGTSYPVKVTVRNEGNAFDPVLGYALGLLDPEGTPAQTVWVHREVPTGETIALEFVLDAPAAAGTYSLRMFQHGVEVFGEELRVELKPAGSSPAFDK
jgi:hypothetical protein